MAHGRRLSCSPGHGARRTGSRGCGSRDRQYIHAQTHGHTTRRRDPRGASRNAPHCDFGSVSRRPFDCRHHRADSRGGPGHREATDPRCAARRRWRHYWSGDLITGTRMSEFNDSTAKAAGSNRFKRLRLRIVVLGMLVILAFAGSSAYDAWRSYGNALAATNREIGNVATALAEQPAWTFQGIALLLLDSA